MIKGEILRTKKKKYSAQDTYYKTNQAWNNGFQNPNILTESEKTVILQEHLERAKKKGLVIGAKVIFPSHHNPDSYGIITDILNDINLAFSGTVYYSAVPNIIVVNVQWNDTSKPYTYKYAVHEVELKSKDGDESYEGSVLP